MKKFAIILITVVLIGAIGFGIYALFNLTNGFSEPVKSFYLKVDGNNIYSFGTGYSLDSDRELNVDVNEVVSDGAKDYAVKIIPNKISGKNFELRQNYGYFAVSDLTNGFDIERNDNGFVLSVKDGTSMFSLCNILTNALDMPFDNSFGTKGYKNMFTLVVSCGNSVITIDFTVNDVVSGVDLDESIVF